MISRNSSGGERIREGWDGIVQSSAEGGDFVRRNDGVEGSDLWGERHLAAHEKKYIG
jgi:hypothetical protein